LACSSAAHLVFDARAKTYQPSLRLVNVSRWIIETYGADNGLRDLVYNVQRLAGMFVTLTVPNDLSMQIIDFAKSEEHLQNEVCDRQNTIALAIRNHQSLHARAACMVHTLSPYRHRPDAMPWTYIR
jgi:hypothetical protein